MTGYRRTTVRGPEAAFDRLREEFYVEEENDDGLVIVHEAGDHPITDDPVRNLIEEEFGLEEFSAGGKGIGYQKDLPEELRDEEEYEAEQERGTAAGKPVNAQEAHSAIVVLNYIKGEEADSDHVATLEHAIERIRELAVEEPGEEGVMTNSDVKTAIELLEREGVEYLLNRDHPNTVLYHAKDYVTDYVQYGRFPYE